MKEEVKAKLCTFLNVGEEEAFERAVEFLKAKKWSEFWSAIRHLDELVTLESKVCR